MVSIKSSTVSTITSSYTFNMPAGMATGDLLVVSVASYNGFLGFPAFFTQIDQVRNGTGTYPIYLNVGYAIVNSSNSGGQITLTANGGDTNYATVAQVVISGHNSTTPIGTTNYNAGTSDATSFGTQATTLTAPGRDLFFIATMANAAVSPTHTSVSGHTLLAQGRGSANTYHAQSILSGTTAYHPTGTSIGPAVITVSQSSGIGRVVSINEGNTAPNVTTRSTPNTNISQPIVLKWNYSDAESNPQTAYQIGYRPTNSAKDYGVKNYDLSSASHTIPANELVAGEQYDWVVRAKDSGGAWSSWATGTFQTTGFVENLTDDPRARGGGTKPARFLTDRWTANTSYAYFTGQTGPIAEIDSYVRGTVTTARTALGFHVIYNPETGTPAPMANLLPVTPGEPINVSHYFRTSVANSWYLLLKFYDAAGNWLNPNVDVLQTQSVSANTWTRFNVVTTVPNGAFAMAAYTITNASLAAGTTFDATGLLVTRTYYTYPYFDGSTANTSTVTHSWLGNANLSQSTKEINRYAQNKAPNPIPSGALGFSGNGSWVYDGANAAIAYTTPAAGTFSSFYPSGTDTLIPATKGDTVEARFLYKGPGDRTAIWHVCDSGGTIIEQIVQTLPSSPSAFVQVVCGGTITAASATQTRFVQLCYGNTSTGAGGTHYFKNIIVNEVNNSNAYFNGDTTDDNSYDYYWSGTPHNSVSIRKDAVWIELDQVLSSTASGILPAQKLTAGNYDIQVRTADADAAWGDWANRSITLGPSTNTYIKSSGSFTAGTKKVRVGGVWVDVGPVKVRQGGSFI